MARQPRTVATGETRAETAPGAIPAANDQPQLPINPAETSGDYNAMVDHWNKVETILNGVEAMRAARETYMPKMPNEDINDYNYRIQNAKFTNIYEDIVTSLASKPFAQECTVADDASDRIKALAEDIDGRGNNLHVFASQVFFYGINYAIDWILIDFTKYQRPGAAPNRPLTQNEEAKLNMRPYWVHVPAKRMLAAYSAKINGVEQLVHCRIEENVTMRSGFSEKLVKQVRIFNRNPVFQEGLADPVDWEPATYEVWRQDQTGGPWTRAENGSVSIGIVPVVPYATGRRKGGTWQFAPPMKSAADLQIEHFQQETNLKAIKEHAAFPILSGDGVTPQKNADGSIKAIPIGPKAVLYAPPSADGGQPGSWKFIEPSADSLKFLADEVKNTEAQMREIGRQPLTATAGITVVVAGLASQKASSAVQAWALSLKDALEQAFRITEMWLKEAKPTTVNVHTDFALDPNDASSKTFLMEMRKNGDLSREGLWEEAQRRGDLRPDFDPETELDRLDQEMDDKIEEDDAAAARMIAINQARGTPPAEGTPPNEDEPPAEE